MESCSLLSGSGKSSLSGYTFGAQEHTVEKEDFHFLGCYCKYNELSAMLVGWTLLTPRLKKTTETAKFLSSEKCKLPRTQKMRISIRK